MRNPWTIAEIGKSNSPQCGLAARKQREQQRAEQIGAAADPGDGARLRALHGEEPPAERRRPAVTEERAQQPYQRPGRGGMYQEVVLMAKKCVAAPDAPLQEEGNGDERAKVALQEGRVDTPAQASVRADEGAVVPERRTVGGITAFQKEGAM